MERGTGTTVTLAAVERISGGIGGQSTNVPTIDLSVLSRLCSNTGDKARLASEMYEACTRAGCFMIQKHWIN